MSLVFVEKKTNILRRVVFDEKQTDKQLSKNHKKQPDERVTSTDLRRSDFASDADFVTAIQAEVSQHID